MRRTLLILLLIVPSTSCRGPLTKPMADRLDDKTQSRVDAVWTELVDSPAVDRTLLLDAIVAAQLYQNGVDSLQLISEKQVGSGVVIMTVEFDRDDPRQDEFSLTYTDGGGYEVWEERFSRDEVEDSIRILFDQSNETVELESEREQRMKRLQEILSPIREEEESDE